jgi:cytochrome P450
VNGGPFVLGMDRGCRLAREREALYRALAEVDLTPIHDQAAAEAEQHLDAASGSIDVVNGYARIIAAHTAERLFGIGPDVDFPLFMDAIRAVFAHTFLNQADDAAIKARALRAGELMRAWFEGEIAKRRKSGELGHDMMGAWMRNTWLDDDTVRRTLGGMLVGSIDTTASSVAKIVWVLAKDKTLLAAVKADADSPSKLGGWCHEALRRWPHNPAVLRRAATDTVFNTVQVKKGDQIIAWTQAAMMDPTVFPRPGLLRPDRPSAHYLHFGGGLHPCAGRVVNDFQIPLLVGALVRRGIKSVGTVQWAGPFPAHLPVRFQR